MQAGVAQEALPPQPCCPERRSVLWWEFERHNLSVYISLVKKINALAQCGPQQDELTTAN